MSENKDDDRFVNIDTVHALRSLEGVEVKDLEEQIYSKTCKSNQKQTPSKHGGHYPRILERLKLNKDNN